MQTIGERLEEARKRKGISIREAAEATKIRSDYLHKFEGNQFDINLSEIYVRGFLRVYAQLLKLPADKILNDYAALGRSADSRSRQPSREVYGRMDISVASAGEKHSDVAPAPAPGPENATGNIEQPRRAPSLHRSGSSLPKMPVIDIGVLIKVGLGLGALVILFLVGWGIVSLFSSKGESSRSQAQTNTVSTQRSLALVALKTVTVSVVNKNPDGSEGAQLFYGTLNAGQKQVVAWPGPLFIKANARENLEIEVGGKRYSTQSAGEGKVEMQAP